MTHSLTHLLTYLLLAASPSVVSKLQKQLQKLSHMTPRGLCNMGATCFMNSVLQVLAYSSTHSPTHSLTYSTHKTIMHNPVILESKSSLLGVNNCTKRLYDKNQVKVPQGWTLTHSLTYSLTHSLTHSLINRY